MTTTTILLLFSNHKLINLLVFSRKELSFMR